jgi:hypothetical protein
MSTSYMSYQPQLSVTEIFFLSHFWKQVFNQQGVDLYYFTTYPPQTDGRTEIVNKCLENYLCCMIRENPTQWVK